MPVRRAARLAQRDSRRLRGDRAAAARRRRARAAATLPTGATTWTRCCGRTWNGGAACRRIRGISNRLRSFLLGALTGVLATGVAILAVIRFGHWRVDAQAEPPALEARLLHSALDRALARGARATDPTPVTNDCLLAGMKLYRNNCLGVSWRRSSEERLGHDVVLPARAAVRLRSVEAERFADLRDREARDSLHGDGGVERAHVGRRDLGRVSLSQPPRFASRAGRGGMETSRALARRERSGRRPYRLLKRPVNAQCKMHNVENIECFTFGIRHFSFRRRFSAAC